MPNHYFCLFIFFSLCSEWFLLWLLRMKTVDNLPRGSFNSIFTFYWHRCFNCDTRSNLLETSHSFYCHKYNPLWIITFLLSSVHFLTVYSSEWEWKYINNKNEINFVIYSLELIQRRVQCYKWIVKNQQLIAHRSSNQPSLEQYMI